MLKKPWLSHLLRVFLVGLLYFGAGKFGLTLAFVNASATAVWPPTGIALAAFLLLGPGIWPAIWVGAFLVNLTTSGSAASALVIAIGNTLEGFAGAYLVNRFARGAGAFDRAADIFKFTLLAGLIAPAISASIGVTTLLVSGLAAPSDYGSVWLTWWLGDVAGALLVTPLLVLWVSHWRVPFTRPRALEGGLLVATLVLAALFVFGGLSPLSTKTYPLEFVVLPIVVWAAFRFGQRDTVTVTALLAGIAIWGTLHHLGPFARVTPNEALLLLQAFVGTITMAGLVLAAAVSERRQIELGLHQEQANLRLSRDELTVILQSAADGILAQDPSGRLRYANNSAARFMGYPSSHSLLAAPPGEVMSQFDLYDEAERPLSQAQLPAQLVLRGAPQAAATIRYRHRVTGAEHWSAETATPVFGAGGQLELVIDVLHDMTEMKRAELEQRLVALASRLLAAPLDQDTRLGELASLVVPYLADLCAIHVLEPDNNVRFVTLARRTPPPESEATLQQNWPAPSWDSNRTVVQVMRTGRPLLIAEITDDMLRANAPTDEHYEQLRAAHLRSGMVVPLMARGHTLGAMTFIWAESDRHYQPADLVLAEGLAGQASLAADNARLFQDAQTLNAELETRIQQRTRQLQLAQAETQALNQRLRVAREEERTSIAREIHDELGQQLTGFKYDVVKLGKGLAEYKAEALQVITRDMLQAINTTIETVRRIATELRPAILDDFGLLAAIEWQVEEIGRRTGITGRFQSQIESVELERDAATAIFRACQEALTNIARHSGATRIEVKVEAASGWLVVVIRDNGRGISAAELGGAKSLGLVGMRERVQSAGGTLTISGEPGQGTTVQIQVPFNPG